MKKYIFLEYLTQNCEIYENLAEFHEAQNSNLAYLVNYFPTLNSTTVGIRLPDLYNNQMVKTCLIAKWFIN